MLDTNVLRGVMSISAPGCIKRSKAGALLALRIDNAAWRTTDGFKKVEVVCIMLYGNPSCDFSSFIYMNLTYYDISHSI